MDQFPFKHAPEQKKIFLKASPKRFLTSATPSPGDDILVTWVIDESKTRRLASWKANLKTVEEFISTEVLAIEFLNYLPKQLYHTTRTSVEFKHDFNGAKFVSEEPTQSSSRRPSITWVFSFEDASSFCTIIDINLREMRPSKLVANWFAKCRYKKNLES